MRWLKSAHRAVRLLRPTANKQKGKIMTTFQTEMQNRAGHTLRGVVTLPSDSGGAAPVVLHLHGFMGSKSGYRSAYVHMARALANAGFACVRFDFYGNCESDGEFEDMTFTSLLQDTQDLYAWVCRQPWADPCRVALSGQSMGGYVAASAAPGLSPWALVLQCPGAGMWCGCRERADALTEKGLQYADVDGLRFSTAFNYDLAGYEPWETAKGYLGPVLLVRGTEDKLVDDATCEKYAALYSPACRFVRVEGGDHNFASVPARAACEAAVTEFLRAQSV